MDYERTAAPPQNIGALSRKEAASFCSISTRQLDKLAAEGKIPRCKIGRRSLFIAADLEAFLRSCRQ